MPKYLPFKKPLAIIIPHSILFFYYKWKGKTPFIPTEGQLQPQRDIVLFFYAVAKEKTTASLWGETMVGWKWLGKQGLDIDQTTKVSLHHQSWSTSPTSPPQAPSLPASVTIPFTLLLSCYCSLEPVFWGSSWQSVNIALTCQPWTEMWTLMVLAGPRSSVDTLLEQKENKQERGAGKGGGGKCIKSTRCLGSIGLTRFTTAPSVFA